MVALGLICTALAFVAFFELIKEIGSTRATVITYVNPAVAVVLGVVFLGESFNAGTGVGFALILAGSWLSTAPRRDAFDKRRIPPRSLLRPTLILDKNAWPTAVDAPPRR